MTLKPKHDLPARLQSDINRRASHIRSLLQKSASVWLDIAKEVTDAAETYDKDAFELFLQKASLTKSIADKMKRIARASRLYLDDSKRYLAKLEGWTTLYEVAKLSQSEMTDLFKELDRAPHQLLTRAFIAQFKIKTKTATTRSLTIASINFSIDPADSLNIQQFQTLKRDLDEIHHIIDRARYSCQFSINKTALKLIEGDVNRSTDSIIVSNAVSPIIEFPNADSTDFQSTHSHH